MYTFLLVGGGCGVGTVLVTEPQSTIYIPYKFELRLGVGGVGMLLGGGRNSHGLSILILRTLYRSLTNVDSTEVINLQGQLK